MANITTATTHLRLVPGPQAATSSKAASGTKAATSPKTAPKLKPEQLINQVAEHTFEAMSYCWFTAQDMGMSDLPLNRFMTALYRVTEQSEAMWQPLVMAYFAPVIYALDAELDAVAAGQSVRQEILQQAIREAQTAALASLRAGV